MQNFKTTLLDKPSPVCSHVAVATKALCMHSMIVHRTRKPDSALARLTTAKGCIDLLHLRAQAKANRGILYVDEVNLLDDGLVDVVLDSSASGVNTVEREGVGIVHPAKFIMIGSGNPQARVVLLKPQHIPSDPLAPCA